MVECCILDVNVIKGIRFDYLYKVVIMVVL